MYAMSEAPFAQLLAFFSSTTMKSKIFVNENELIFVTNTRTKFGSFRQRNENYTEIQLTDEDDD